MRLIQNALLALSLIAMLSGSASIQAAPLTGGTGPGGVGLTDGSTSLELWLRSDRGLYQDTGATTVATNGTNVALWQDQSGNGNNVTQPGASTTRPTLQSAGGPNSQPRLAFDGGDSLNFGSYTFSGTDLGLFVSRVNTSAFQSLLSDATINKGYSANAGSSMQWFDESQNTGFNLALSYRTNGAATAVYTAAFPSPFVIAEGFNRNAANTASGFTGTSTNLKVGGGHGSAVALDGDHSEIIIYNSAPNSAQRIILENYLSARYDVALNTTFVPSSSAATDVYDGDTPGNGNFDFGVFGIGRVNASNQQLTSGSEGLGLEVASLPTDDTWVLAGYATSSNGVTTTDAKAGNSRWERSWYIDTKGVGAANLAFDWNDASVLSAFNSGYYGLYYRPNNSGVFSLIAYGTVDIPNQRVDFANVSLADGYYTLGTVIPEPSTLALLGLGIVGLTVKARRRRQIS